MHPEPGARLPHRAILGLALGFVAATLVWNALPYGPADALPSLAAAPKSPPIEWPPRATDDGFRVIAVGLSTTVGYPYQPLGAASFAALCEVGLREGTATAAAVRVAPLAMDSADSPSVVELCRRALDHAPDLLVVEIGSNEAATRIFGETRLIEPGWLGAVADRATRARLFFDDLAAEPHAAPAAGNPMQRFLDAIWAARPGAPLVGGLPVSEAEVAALAARVARCVDRIAALTAAAGVEVVLWASPYDLRHAWPLGMVAHDPVVDRLVLRHRRGQPFGDAERALLDARADRADVQHLLGRLALAAGDAAAAAEHLARARDLDPAPWHVVGPWIDALRRGAERHSHVRFVDLAAGLDARFDARFVDGMHPDVDGQRALAGRLLALLGEFGVAVPDPAASDAAIRRHVERVLPSRARRIAEGRGARLAVVGHMVLGSVRDALPRFADALDGFALEVAGPDDPNWQQWVAIAVIASAAVAGQLDVVAGWSPEERVARTVEAARALWGMDREQRGAWLLEGASVGAPVAPPERRTPR